MIDHQASKLPLRTLLFVALQEQLVFGAGLKSSAVFPYNWRCTIVGDRAAVEGGVKRCHNKSKYCVTRQGGARASRHAVGYKIVNHTVVLARKFYDSVDSVQRNSDVKDVQALEGNGEEFFDESD